MATKKNTKKAASGEKLFEGYERREAKIAAERAARAERQARREAAQAAAIAEKTAQE